MWLLVQFDLPMESKLLRRTYAHFRRDIRKMGFEAFQKSIYARWEDGDAAADATVVRIRRLLPENGRVSILRFSDRTMSQSVFFENGASVPPPSPPSGFLLL